jgi:hypothetical protein
MPDCPFSRDRLHELLWAEHWRPDQVAALAQAATGDETTEGDVRAWCRALEVAIPAPPAPPAPKPSAPRKPRATGRRGTGMETRPCWQCAAPVTRWPSDFRPGGCFCSPDCAKAWRAQAATELREARRRELESAREQERVPSGRGAAVPSKTCGGCGVEKSITLFAAEPRRLHGVARICLECQREKSRAYYLRHQETLKARALARKRALKGEAK